ncbi:MAG: serine acetyltransferase [Prevotella sp.]|nr:serine acetyltransferase [Prevotella sp.]
MKDIAIFGAGGFGKEVACLIERINETTELDEYKYRLIGFFDDGVAKGTQISVYGKVLGGMDELNAWLTPLSVAIAIGSPRALQFVQQRIVNPDIAFPNLIHPNFSVADERAFSIGRGNIIQGDCFASCDVKIGSFNVLNGSVVMGHDAQMGNYNVCMPDIRISGEVSIGDGNLLGVGSIVLQQLKIGNGVRLGAGAVLMTKPKDGGVYLGNPAKLFKY